MRNSRRKSHACSQSPSIHRQELRRLRDFVIMLAPAQNLPALLKSTTWCWLLTSPEFLAVAVRQAAAALTNSAAEPAGSVAAAAPAQPAATAATPAANGTAAATSGTTAAAAEVADAARRLRMDQALAARAQAELRISKPQVGRPFLITVYVSHRYRQGWRRGRRQSCASASRRSGSGTSSHQRHCLRVLLPGLPQLNHKLCPEASAWPPVMGSVRAELPAAASVWQSAPPLLLTRSSAPS